MGRQGTKLTIAAAVDRRLFLPCGPSFNRWFTALDKSQSAPNRACLQAAVEKPVTSRMSASDRSVVPEAAASSVPLLRCLLLGLAVLPRLPTCIDFAAERGVMGAGLRLAGDSESVVALTSPRTRLGPCGGCTTLVAAASTEWDSCLKDNRRPEVGDAAVITAAAAAAAG